MSGRLPAADDDADIAAGRKLLLAAYALQALGFLFGITFIAAVVLDYVKRDDFRATWLDSHFRWQIRTFWFALLWFVIGSVTWFIAVGYFVLAANTVWVIYRIAKGWLRLGEGKAMYA